jgi:hypothetical protein
MRQNTASPPPQRPGNCDAHSIVTTSPLYLLTLFHGTWAPGADWTHEESPLCQALKDKFGDRITFDRFCWSGRNSHRARCGAALGLRAHVCRNHERLAGYQQYLIAHSHAGNVCLYALRDDDVRQAIRGVITLSTPFILCRRRDFGRYRTASLVSLLFMLFLIFACIIHIKYVHSYGYVVYVIWAMGYLSILAIANSEARIRSLFSRLTSAPLVSRITAFARGLDLASLAKSFDLALPASGGLLVVRAPGDEASAALMTSYIVAWAFTKIGKCLDFPFTVGDRIVRFTNASVDKLETLQANVKLSTLLLFVVLPAVILISIGTLTYGVISICATLLRCSILLFAFADFWKLFAMIMWVFGNSLTALSGMLVLPLMMLVSLVLTPFGLDCSLLAPFFELTSEATPLGPHQMLLTSPITVVGLWHSVPYQDKHVYVQISDWISMRSGDELNGDAHES